MEITLQKCGIRINPPAFLIIYSAGKKLRKKVMPLRDFMKYSDIKFAANDLKQRHALENIPTAKVEKLLRLLQERLRGSEESGAFTKIENQYNTKVNEDLNKLDTQELEDQKKLMDSLFLKNQIKKEDENFVYDKEVDFPGEKEESNWDKDSDSNFWD